MNLKANALFPFLIIFLFGQFVLGASVKADGVSKSEAYYQYKRCFRRATELGGGKRNVYVAWASGLAHTCLFSEFPPNKARPFVLRKCEQSMRKLRRQLRVQTPCIIVVERGKVLDSVYRRAVFQPASILTAITVFDGKNQPRKMQGVYRESPTKFEGPNATELNFWLTGDGIPLCSGKIVAAGFNRARWKARCFDQEFEGVVRGAKTITQRGLVYLVPQKARVEREGAWIEVEF
ncbi:hypothetical protein [uncultured Roseobacter sp.]|uniref:hypothetical protein n=1 Tax=uncultured Roseobacter sp. TaxID=114847 RepID=UPI0026287B71|nr:hypothetical protein [uncultured Roseobacter sp.]